MGARGRLAPPAHGCQLRLRRRHEVYITLSVRYIMPECRGVFINHLTLQSCWTRRLQRFREVKIMTLRSHIIRPPRLHGLTESERQLVAWIVHSDQPQIDLLSILSVSCGVCHAPAQWLMYSTSTYYIILCRTQNDVFCRLGVLGLRSSATSRCSIHWANNKRNESLFSNVKRATLQGKTLKWSRLMAYV